MASDSREEQAVTVDLPAELDEWLDDRADALGVDREDVIVQLLASYHAAASLDGGLDPREVLGEHASEVLDVEGAVDAVVEDRGEDIVEEAVATAVERELADRLADEVEAAVEEHLPTVTDAVEGRLEERIDDIVAGRLEDSVAESIEERVEAAVEERVEAAIEERVEAAVRDVVDDRIDALDAEFQEKIVDVRERVIQVKREADGKADADHDHEAFERIDEFDSRLEDLAATIDQLEATVESVSDELQAEVEDVADVQDAVDERLSDTEDKLKRVAWVVSDLKDDSGGRSAHEQAVARIKHAAAQEGVTAADCERCGESVDVALLTDPECPHCNATVSDVRPTGGIFRTKAKLVAAAQLESGEDE